MVHGMRRSGRLVMSVGAAALMWMLAGCGGDEGSTESIAEIQKREGIPVRTIAVTRGTLRVTERLGGTVEGYAQTTLGAGVPGTLTRYGAAVGRRVGKGTVVARIDPDVASPYAMAKAQYDQVAKSRERVTALAEEGGVPQEAVDQIEAAYTAAKEQLDAATKSVNILAPFAGTIIEQKIPLGSKVGPGQSLVTIADLRRTRVTLDVNETMIGEFAVGQRAYILLGNDSLFGEVAKIPIGAREQGHMFPVDVVFDNPDTRLKPGMFVTVHVITTELPDALALPAELVMRDDTGAYVYSVDGDKARRTRLDLGVRGGGRMSVNHGLAEGDVVVAEGAGKVSDGVKVRVVQ